jgi:hypothetical protein
MQRLPGRELHVEVAEAIRLLPKPSNIEFLVESTADFVTFGVSDC